MGKMKDKESGDYAPSRTPYFPVGRFVLTRSPTGKIWMRDIQEGEAAPIKEEDLEAALLQFWGENF